MLAQWFSTRGDFVLREHLGSSGDMFDCLDWEQRLCWYLMGQVQGAAKYPIMPRTTPMTNY